MKRLVAGLALATAAATLAAPSSARLVTAEPIGAVTTITATSSGTASLVLYDDATVSAAPTDNPDVTISGKGRLVGFDLVSTQQQYSGDSVDELTAKRLPAFAGSATYVTGNVAVPQKCSGWPSDDVPVQQECSNCTYSPSPMVPAQSDCTYARPKLFKLHEGYYHLSVLTDGAPLRITIRLHGVGKSHRTVHLQSTFRSLETPLTQHESIGTSTITFGGSASFANPTNVLTVVGAKIHPASTFAAATGCLRSDTGAPPPYAYSPACPGGQITGYSSRLNAPAGGVGAGDTTVFFGPVLTDETPNGVGGSIVDSDGPTYLGGLALWTDSAELPFWP